MAIDVFYCFYISFINSIFIAIIKPEYKKLLIIVNIFISIFYILWRFTVIPIHSGLICTYNEPLDLLQKTIIASIKLNYPKNKVKIYVCDDGKRNELKNLCKRYKVNYITREDNGGAKARN